MNSNSFLLKNRLAVALAAVLAIAACSLWLRSRPVVVEAPVPNLPAGCRDVIFEEQSFVLCTADANSRISLALYDGAGRPCGNLAALSRAQRFDFAMNAGMYHEDKSPVGLYVESGRELAPLNTDDAEGNFFMKPNGVFFVDRDGKPGVLETQAYAAARADVPYATQSGPMLVIEGDVHPRFEADGSSRYVRNGVGIDAQGLAVFAISRAPVSLGKFARLFRDGVGCRNALFFDGAISALHDGKKYVIGGGYPAGPLVSIVQRPGGPD